MTEGHTHRRVRMKRSSRLYRMLTRPLVWSEDYAALDASPYPWRAKDEAAFRQGVRDQPYCLSALGILHRWTGLTLHLMDER